MYKLRPLFNAAAETPHPSCVYKMKKIGDNFNHSKTEANGTEANNRADATSGDCEIEELEKRWTEITSRLQRLQSELAAVKTGSSPALSTFVDSEPAPPLTVKALAVQQDLLVLRISSLMTSLFELKSRLALMDDPQSISSTTVLQLQQRALLERIKQLNDEIRSISSALNNNNNHGKESDSAQSQCSTKQADTLALGVRGFQDLVIRASPSRPPHSLPLLKQRLDQLGVSVFARTHVHSNVAENKLVNDALKNFISSDPRLERSKAHIALTLIWTKDDDEPTLVVSPSSQAVAIQGEANIARYLARLIPALLDYESQPSRAAQLDLFLDLTESTAPLGIRGVKRERPATLNSLEKTLTTQKSLEGGDQAGVVDFVVYSAIANAGVDKEIGTNVRAWIDRCRSTSLVSAAPTDSKRSRLENYLTELGVAFHTVEHPAVFTVAAMMEHISHLSGFHAKNLLVKDKKSGQLYLITARHDALVQLNSLAKAIGAKELRFADAETLEASLGVQQGSVTPFALLNDAQKHQVSFVLDSQLWNEKNGDGQETLLNFHPLTNEATTSITVAGLKTFLKATGHEPITIQV